MKKHSVKRVAQLLRGLVDITLGCNVLAFFIVPRMVRLYSKYWPELAGQPELLWRSQEPLALVLFLWFCGVCTLFILWQARRVLGSVLRETPFSEGNARALRRAAAGSFLIAGAALIRAALRILWRGSLWTLASYNTLFVPLFAMFGLLCLVMSALFRQAAEQKAEYDLTI